MFRGFAVQAQESTESFNMQKPKFVGEFVNPPAKGDWRIWHCAAVSIIIIKRYIYTVGRVLIASIY